MAHKWHLIYQNILIKKDFVPFSQLSTSNSKPIWWPIFIVYDSIFVAKDLTDYFVSIAKLVF